MDELAGQVVIQRDGQKVAMNIEPTQCLKFFWYVNDELYFPVQVLAFQTPHELADAPDQWFVPEHGEWGCLGKTLFVSRREALAAQKELNEDTLSALADITRVIVAELE